MGAIASLIVTLYTLTACGESPLVPANSGPMPRLDLSVWLLDAGDTIPVHAAAGGQWTASGRIAPSPGLLVISGTFWPGEVKGRLRRITRATVRVNATDALGDRQSDGALRFALEAPMPRSDDSLAVGLPQVDGAQPSFTTLRIRLATHPSDQGAMLSGGELRLPIARASQPTVPSPWVRRWALGLRRDGAGQVRIDGTTPLPAELVVPIASVLPGEGPVDVRLSDDVLLYDQPVSGRETTYIFSVHVISTLRWAMLSQPAVAP